MDNHRTRHQYSLYEPGFSMTKRADRRKRQEVRRWAERQYIKHRRHNMVYAQPGRHKFIIVLDNLKPSFNIGKIFRSGDAFGACAIHLIGTEYFEVKPAKGSFKWIPARFHQSFRECYDLLSAEGYTFFVMDPAAGKELFQVELPEKSAFIFGHEEYGISFTPAAFENINMVKIPQFGRVESLNVSIAASIAMYEYVRQQVP